MICAIRSLCITTKNWGNPIYAPINVIAGGGGASREGDFDKAFMPEGVAFGFMDSPQGADI